jgi:hypothetical protein
MSAGDQPANGQRRGLPLGLQIIGPRGRDVFVLDLTAAYEGVAGGCLGRRRMEVEPFHGVAWEVRARLDVFLSIRFGLR